MEGIVDRYGHSQERIAILQGLCSYRSHLASLGIMNGFQWVCGSFTEDIEQSEKRPPGDVDVITFAYRPSQALVAADWLEFIKNNLDVFNPGWIKHTYRCDAYYIYLNKPPHLVVADTSYWFGLFSHRRDSVWKGMLRIDLNTDDNAAKAKLAGWAPC